MGNLLGNTSFSIDFDGHRAQVRELTIQDQQVYRILFEDGSQPLTITRASTWAGRTWMSIPQGRQQEAENIGKLIAEKLKER